MRSKPINGRAIQHTVGRLDIMNAREWAELAREIDRGWRAFWARRHMQPPPLSREVICGNMDVDGIGEQTRKAIRKGV